VPQQYIYQPLSEPVAAEDCVVELWGIDGVGGFDCETQGAYVIE